MSFNDCLQKLDNAHAREVKSITSTAPEILSLDERKQLCNLGYPIIAHHTEGVAATGDHHV